MINAANLQKPFRTHKRVAGTMPFDSNIEFIGIPSTQEVIWFQYGNQHSFNTVPKIVLKQLQTKFFSDSPAVRDLAKIDATLERKIEIYTYFCFGDADFTPDVIDGILQPSENFRHSVDCISLKWKNKDLTIDGKVLNTNRGFENIGAFYNNTFQVKNGNVISWINQNGTKVNTVENEASGYDGNSILNKLENGNYQLTKDGIIILKEESLVQLPEFLKSFTKK